MFAQLECICQHYHTRQCALNFAKNVGNIICPRQYWLGLRLFEWGWEVEVTKLWESENNCYISLRVLYMYFPTDYFTMIISAKRYRVFFEKWRLKCWCWDDWEFVVEKLSLRIWDVKVKGTEVLAERWRAEGPKTSYSSLKGFLHSQSGKNHL